MLNHGFHKRHGWRILRIFLGSRPRLPSDHTSDRGTDGYDDECQEGSVANVGDCGDHAAARCAEDEGDEEEGEVSELFDDG
mmetsp:Transcript_7291/g.14642  ORF Transcript_7291/g.14642 Transcript_7291/m.14642 type:complete len:81 (+) Transcript_7291:206-448(+)